jgi:hypothetical protein
MSIAAAKGMSAKEAVERALMYFREFFSDQVIVNVLLEELDFDESDRTWLVKIGFDIGRKSIKQPSRNALATLYGEQELTPIREARTFVLEDDGGNLVKMSDE